MSQVAELIALESSTSSGLKVRKLQPAIGAEISGIDLGLGISGSQAGEIRQALLENGVIFFRNQMLDYDSHRAFAEHFGEIRGEGVQGRDLKVFRSRAGSTEGTAAAWHSDGCYMKIPPAISILRSITVPPLGGDTCFASAAAAYAGLSEELKQCIASLRYTSSGAGLLMRGSNGMFDKEETERRMAEYPEVSHPVVRVHPETGTPVIYTNHAQSHGIVGLDNDIGHTLLRYLSDRLKQPEYQVRWHWEPNDVAMWDNRTVQHYGVPNQTGDRHLERLMVGGTIPMSLADWAAAHPA